MKTTLMISALLLCASVKAQSQTQASGSGTLSIHAINFKSDEGEALAKLYRKEDEMPGKPYMETGTTISDGKAVISFTDIPYGDYALIVCHDENSNGRIDHNFLGIPAEPLGFSNGWKLSLFSGMPSFTKLKFEFSEQKQECKIDIE